MSRRLEIAFLLIILLLYGILAYQFASRTPAWQIPDEPAHYNYSRQVVETGELPVIEMGDWNQPYLNLILRCNFHPATIGQPDDQQNLAYLEACDYDPALASDIRRVEYEDHQPPLYYLLQSVVYRVSDGDLVTMRFFSAILGAGAVLCAWLMIRLLVPQAPYLGLIGAAVIAFLPQRLAIMAGVSNDSLAETLAALLLLLSIYALLNPQVPKMRYWVLMGIVAGLIFLTKTTAYYMAGIAGLSILLRWWREKWPLRQALITIAAFSVPALLMGLIWWVHGIQTYGGVDILGLQRHDEVVIGQLRTEDYIHEQLGGSQRLYWENMLKTTFHSFWGQFGWMALPMPPRVYQLIQLALVLSGIGLALFFYQRRLWQAPIRPQREILALLLLSIGLVIAQFLFYNRMFVQFQGRYLYPALLPLAFLIALGVWGYLLVAERYLPFKKWLPTLTVIAIVAMMTLFARYALHDIIIVLPKWAAS